MKCGCPDGITSYQFHRAGLSHIKLLKPYIFYTCNGVVLPGLVSSPVFPEKCAPASAVHVLSYQPCCRPLQAARSGSRLHTWGWCLEFSATSSPHSVSRGRLTRLFTVLVLQSQVKFFSLRLASEYRFLGPFVYFTFLVGVLCAGTSNYL